MSEIVRYYSADCVDGICRQHANCCSASFSVKSMLTQRFSAFVPKVAHGTRGKFFTTPRISSTRGSHANTESSLRIASDEVNNFEPHRVPATAAEACGHPLARARPSRLSARGREPLGDSVEYIYPVTKARVAAQIPGRYGHISCSRLTRAKVKEVHHDFGLVARTSVSRRRLFRRARHGNHVCSSGCGQGTGPQSGSSCPSA